MSKCRNIYGREASQEKTDLAIIKTNQIKPNVPTMLIAAKNSQMIIKCHNFIFFPSIFPQILIFGFYFIISCTFTLWTFTIFHIRIPLTYKNVINHTTICTFDSFFKWFRHNSLYPYKKAQRSMFGLTTQGLSPPSLYTEIGHFIVVWRVFVSLVIF